MHAPRIRPESISAATVFKTVNVRESATSTNDVLRKIDVSSCQIPYLLVAIRQIAGRGRNGKRWRSLNGSLLYSLLIGSELDRPTFYSTISAMAICDAIEDICQLKPSIKWPNDVLVFGKKVAGVLIESHSKSPDRLVIGIGVNTNCRIDPNDNELNSAASLSQFTNRILNHENFLISWSQSFFSWLESAKASASHAILDNYHERTAFRPQSDIELILAGGKKVTGRFSGFGEFGELILDVAGNEIAFSTGSVSRFD